MAKIVFITATGTFTIPSDWNSANNKIECIGSGGTGGSGTAASNSGGGGGGGGEYRVLNNIAYTAGASISVLIGAGGSTQNSVWDNAGVGTVCSAVFGTSGSGGTGGAGGTGGTGGTGNNGGTGGSTSTAMSGGGGGGAAGPNGVGKTGASPNALEGGGGGGGANNGSNGNTGSAATGGTGGNNRSSSGGGAAGGGAGSNGGGGGGGNTTSSETGGAGSQDTIWTQTSDSSTAGPGSGGGGGGGLGAVGAFSGGNAGGYGAGGGGGNDPSSGTSSGGTGSQGIIVLTYEPVLSWLAPSQTKTLRLKQSGGSLLAGVITPQPAAVFNYRSVYPDRTALPERKYYTNPNTPFIVPTTPTATSIPWLPTFDDINPVKAPTSQGWFAESTNGMTATSFPQWLATYSNIVPNLTKKPNVGSVTFNPYAIAPATYQVLATYPDKLLAVPTIFPAGYISNPTPQIVTVTALNWLPTFIDKTTPLPLQINQGWFAKISGAGATVFPAWLGYYPDTGPRITSGWPIGASILSTNEATATTFPQWLSLYTDKVPTRPISVNTGLFVNNSPSTVVVNVFPSWLPVYPGSTKQNKALQAEFIANVLYGVAIPVPVPVVVTNVPGPSDKIDEDRRNLLNKIKWYESKRRLREKERRHLALLRHQLDQKDVEEKVLAELPIPMEKESLVNTEALNAFAAAVKDNSGLFRQTAMQGLHNDANSEDDEDFLMLGD